MMPDKESRKLLNIERFCLALVSYVVTLQQILETLHSLNINFNLPTNSLRILETHKLIESHA